MDRSRFDALSRVVAQRRSRRYLSRLLAGLALGGPLALGRSAESAAKGKKKKKGKKRQSTSPVLVVPPPVVPPPVGTPCTSRDDCPSALCSSGTCQACTKTPNTCGSDDDGQCYCEVPVNTPEGPPVCVKFGSIGPSGPNCTCPINTVCIGPSISVSSCYKRCGVV